MAAKRKILMITPYIPRLSQSGGQRHSFYTIKYLSQKNEITLICYSRDQIGLDTIKKFCRQVIIVKRGKTWDLRKIIHTCFSFFPFLLINYINNDFKKIIETEIANHHYDLIHCDCLYPMPNIPPTKIPIVLVDVTIEYAVYQHYVQSLRDWKRLLAPFLWLDVLKLKYWETYYWKNTHAVITFGPEDQKLVSQITGRKDIYIFEDAVDPGQFFLPLKTRKSSQPSILFGVSNMKWMQNRESAQLIIDNYWPSISQKYPHAKLFIIGRNAPQFFAHYQSTNITVAEADDEGGLHDPQYYYEHCWLLLAPMGSGGGTRNKFLEGMTFGLPIITTTEGGMGNIKIRNLVHAVVCPKNQVLRHVSRIIDDPNYRRSLGLAAKKLIREHYSFDKSVDQLNQIYDQIT